MPLRQPDLPIFTASFPTIWHVSWQNKGDRQTKVNLALPGGRYPYPQKYDTFPCLAFTVVYGIHILGYGKYMFTTTTCLKLFCHLSLLWDCFLAWTSLGCVQIYECVTTIKFDVSLYRRAALKIDFQYFLFIIKDFLRALSKESLSRAFKHKLTKPVAQ